MLLPDFFALLDDLHGGRRSRIAIAAADRFRASAEATGEEVLGARVEVVSDSDDVTNMFDALHLGRVGPASRLWTGGRVGKTFALSTAALAWGLVNFGLLLWMPSALVRQGYSMEMSSKLLAQSALIALPTVFICALAYSRWSTKWSLIALVAVMLAGLAWVLALETGLGGSPVFPVALLIVGSNGLLAVLLPYASECYPLKVRGRASGWVAACTKAGGVITQSISIAALVPPLGVSAMLVMAPVAVAIGLLAVFGGETRGLDLRRLEASA